MIGVVCAYEFYSDVWKKVPQAISNGTNLQASVVVVTMSDYKPQDSATWSEWLRDIKMEFWPTLAPDFNSCLVLDCSVLHGRPIEEFLPTLHGVLPSPEEIWDGPGLAVKRHTYPGTYINYLITGLRIGLYGQI